MNVLNRFLVVVLILYSQYSYSYYFEYDSKSPTTKVTSIRGISTLYSECGLKTIEGTITNIDRKTSLIEISLKNPQEKTFFQFETRDFSMSELRSLGSILLINQNIRVEGEVCGSGGIFYPVNIINLGKRFSVRTWLDETLDKFGFEK